MHLEARRTRVFTVDRDKYAEPSGEQRKRLTEKVINPFINNKRRNKRGGTVEGYSVLALPTKCKTCHRTAAVNADGRCLKCVVDGMPPVEPAREVFE